MSSMAAVETNKLLSKTYPYSTVQSLLVKKSRSENAGLLAVKFVSLGCQNGRLILPHDRLENREFVRAVLYCVAKDVEHEMLEVVAECLRIQEAAYATDQLVNLFLDPFLPLVERRHAHALPLRLLLLFFLHDLDFRSPLLIKNLFQEFDDPFVDDVGPVLFLL